MLEAGPGASQGWDSFHPAGHSGSYAAPPEPEGARLT